MAQDGKDDDKLEFTPEGEALGYISLDQARVLALQHARDNRDIYGPRYSQMELVWEVVSQEESEDYYDIRLSFRPATGFSGKPGVEQFTIDKTGPITLRQILSQPHSDTRRKAILAGLGLAAIVVAVVGGLAGAGVFSSSSTDIVVDLTAPVIVPITPDTPAQLVSPQGDVTIDVRAGSVNAPTQLTYRRLTIADTPLLPTSFSATGTVFNLTTSAPLLQPITITALFISADAALAGRDEANVIIQHYLDGAWQQLNTSVDFVASDATAQVDRLSIFALTIRVEKAAPTDTPSPRPTETIVPTAAPSPTPIPVTTATSIPAPTATPLPSLSQSEVMELVSEIIAPCNLDVDFENGVTTTVVYSTEYMGDDFWLVDARWPKGNMTYGKWDVDALSGEVFPSDTSAKTILSNIAGDGCTLPLGVRPAVPKPTATPTPTPSPTPTATPRPTQTPRPTNTPRPTSTPRPILSQGEVEVLVLRTISPCKSSIDQAYGATTTVSYSTRYLGQDRWLVDASWPLGNISHGGWSVDSRTGAVTPFDAFAQTVLSLGGRCGLPSSIQPILPTPSPTLRPTATPRPTTAPFCVSLPNTNDYSGSLFNETVSIGADIRATLVQTGCLIIGILSIDSNLLVGSGPLQGVLAGNKLSFTVPGSSNDAGIDLLFSGTVTGGVLAGRYDVPANGQRGTWNLSMLMPQSTPVPTPTAIPTPIPTAVPTPTPIPTSTPTPTPLPTPPVPPSFLAKWGSSGSGDGQFNFPYGLAVGPAGNIFIADTRNNRVQKFDSGGTFITNWGSSGTEASQFNDPRGIAVDASGSVYVVDSFNRRIQKFGSNGTFITSWGSDGQGDGQFSLPYDIAVGSGGRVYVSDTNRNRIQVFDTNGNFILKWGGAGAGDGKFQNLRGIAANANGEVYVVDSDNWRIQKFDSNGGFITTWGTAGPAYGQFNSPEFVAIDSLGRVYVTDSRNHRVQVFTSNGEFITVWGSQGGNDGQFVFPYGIGVDSGGDIYVVDNLNNRIQKFGF